MRAPLFGIRHTNVFFIVYGLLQPVVIADVDEQYENAEYYLVAVVVEDEVDMI